MGKESYEGRNFRFGIREFGMGAVSNAVSLHKSGLVPYCATFTVFSDYMRHAIRMAALAQCGTIFVTTHDSIALGEDGPTHQPIETVRVVSMPCWELFRAQPESYKEALLPKSVPKMSVEAAVTMGWGEWADAFVGINVFGASAPGGTCLDRFGFNVPNIVSCAGRCLRGERGALSDGSQAKSKADARRACSGAAQELRSLLKGLPEIPSKKGSGQVGQEAGDAKVASWPRLLA